MSRLKKLSTHAEKDGLFSRLLVLYTTLDISAQGVIFTKVFTEVLAVARGGIGFGPTSEFPVDFQVPAIFRSLTEDSRLALDSPPPMATNELISAQFDRAVEIVQSLPKTGPIQTDYEEKLAMYR
jgi:hypothetical protein